MFQKHIKHSINKNAVADEKVSRRSFLKRTATIGAGALTLACKPPFEKSLAFETSPEFNPSGDKRYYATTFYNEGDPCPIVVKTHNHRPIKVEGNPYALHTRGKTGAQAQATIFDFYNPDRLQSPQVDHKNISWEALNAEMDRRLKHFAAHNMRITLLYSNSLSELTNQVISNFCEKYPNVSPLCYSNNSYYSINQAYKNTSGKAIIPFHAFNKAKTIVSVGADFLGTWLKPLTFKTDYAEETECNHIQLEPSLSETGAKAQKHILLKPSEYEDFIADLYYAVLSRLEHKDQPEKYTCHFEDTASIADQLMLTSGKSIVLSSSKSVHAQEYVIAINKLLQSYGNTILPEYEIRTNVENPNEIERWKKEIASGSIDGVICLETNPLYDFSELLPAFKKLKLLVSIGANGNETTHFSNVICPTHHFMEAWGCHEPIKGTHYLAQPIVAPLYNTKQKEDVLLNWMGGPDDFLGLLKGYWSRKLKPNKPFEIEWLTLLQKGVFSEQKSLVSRFELDISKLQKNRPININEPISAYELDVFQDCQIGMEQANNAWLQELPHPITKQSWGNAARISQETASKLSLRNGDFISINQHIKMPVLIMPFQHNAVISIAYGYGRRYSGQNADAIGHKVPQKIEGAISIVKASAHETLCISQDTWKSESPEPIFKRVEVDSINTEAPVHKWAMAIDLEKCTGCGTCSISCQVENNIPIVGKAEVEKGRIMHWISPLRNWDADGEKRAIPVLCQHCDNAPCESVCPVAATTHSKDGLNQMVYTRCIGTRYCNNNCAYKARVFNWSSYHDNLHPTQKLMLNPDVSVRSRGVIEKCSFCIQRIQEKKNRAKVENRALKDDEVQTACSATCPSNAIVFGDISNPNSQISKVLREREMYHLLGSLNTQPSVFYLNHNS